MAGEPVLKAEVEGIAEQLARLEPAFTRPHLVRLALTNVALPRAFARTEDRRRWRAARAELAELLADLGAQVEDFSLIPAVETRSGDFEDIGLETWLAALDAPPGAWSEPYEERGAWCAVRVLSRDPAAPAARETWRVAVAQVPFVRDRGNLLERMFAARLEILDPSWTSLVPADWRYRMGAVSRADPR